MSNGPPLLPRFQPWVTFPEALKSDDKYRLYILQRAYQKSDPYGINEAMWLRPDGISLAIEEVMTQFEADKAHYLKTGELPEEIDYSDLLSKMPWKASK